MPLRPVLTVLAIAVLVIVGAYAGMSVIESRDDSGLDHPETAPQAGLRRPAGQGPAVRPGNVVLLYRRAADRAPLAALQEEYSGPPDPALEAAGQAVIVRRSPGLGSEVAAISRRYRIDVSSATSPRIRAFVEAYLGTEDG